MMPGDWVVLRLPPDFVRRGKVVSVDGFSMTVRWPGDDRDRVLPWAGYYIEVGWLELVEAPPVEQQAGMRQEAPGLLEVAQVAAMLGTTSKHVRAMLRSGKLEGERKEGKWLGVASPAVYAVLKSRAGRPTA
jgi:hypothetical protein